MKNIVVRLGYCLFVLIIVQIVLSINVCAEGNTSDVKTGWIKDAEKYYYILPDGECAREMMVDDYWVGEDGVMVTSQWVNTGEGDYYFDSSGKICKLCFQNIDGVLCYFDKNGKIDNTQGLKKEGVDWYYLKENGQLSKNQQVDSIGYFNEDGKLTLYETLFESPLGIQYYGKDGNAVSETVMDIDNQLFYFDSLGLQDASQGWKQSNADWYYMDKNGSLVRDNWVGLYYIGENGKMLRSQYKDRFYINEDGRWEGAFTQGNWKVCGKWKKEENNWYFIGEDGNKSEIDFSRLRSIARCGYDYENPNTPPEQSKESYKLAKEQGFNILLCDLRFTADGVPVCYHYDTINKVARNMDGTEIDMEMSIESMTYAELNEYDWGIYKGEKYKSTKLMSFAEMLSFMEELNSEVYVEIKTGNEIQVKSAVDLAKKYNITISWAGTTMEQCEAVVKANPSARVATMPRNITEEEIKDLLTLKTASNEVFFFAYDTAILTNTTIEILTENNIPFEMGTINTIEEMVNYWNGNYQYCTGIESNWIVASQINLNEYFGEKSKCQK